MLERKRIWDDPVNHPSHYTSGNIEVINRREITSAHFCNAPDSDGILMNRQGIRLFLQAWEQTKRDSLTHPFLKEKMAWGLIPFVQAQLLARYLREELPSYPAFLWR